MGKASGQGVQASSMELVQSHSGGIRENGNSSAVNGMRPDSSAGLEVLLTEPHARPVGGRPLMVTGIRCEGASGSPACPSMQRQPILTQDFTLSLGCDP